MRHSFSQLVLVGAVLLGSQVAAEALYQPLGRKEEKGLRQTAQALTKVLLEQDTASFLKFAPGMLELYASVLIQPDKGQLKALYQGVESSYNAIIASKNTSQAEKAIVQEPQNAISAVEKARIVATVSTARTLEELRQHRERYGHIIDEEIKSFEKKLRDNHRQRVMSNPTITEWLLYREQTGDTNLLIEQQVKTRALEELQKIEARTEDFQLYVSTFGLDGVRQVYENHLYNRFAKELTLQTAMEYIEAFPAGERASVVETWLKLMERQAMSDLETDSTGNSK